MALIDFFNQFGKKATKELEKNDSKEESFAPPSLEDATVLQGGGLVRYEIEANANSDTNEQTLIESWRELATRPEIDWAVQEVVNEAIVSDFIEYPVSLVIDEEGDGVPKKISKRLQEEFSIVLGLLNFNRTATEKFRQWFIDGKTYYHGMIDSKNPSKGLVGIRWIDPRSIKKIVETEKYKNENGIEVERIKDTYYIYNSFSSARGSGLSGITNAKTAIKVHPDAIAYANSGLFRDKGDGTQISISHLDKSLKTANQMRMLEDALVIYRLARAPERRIFYVDVGNLPKTKAEQYLQGIMNRFKNKVHYDTATGEITDARNNLSMLEDFWLPRREGGRGTEVTTLPGGQNLGELTDVEYFQKKLFKALNIPSTRFNGEANFNIGRGSEITREEIKFAKFVSYLRSKFSETFIHLMKIQVITKNIMSEDDWNELHPALVFKWKSDSYWDELMHNEVWQTRVALLQQMDAYVGTFFSRNWIRKNVLLLSNEDIETMEKEIEDEKDDADSDDEPYGPSGDPDFIDRNNDGIPDRTAASRSSIDF